MSATTTGSSVRWLPWARSPAVTLDPLVIRLAAGDAHALAEVYDEHHQALRRFAWRLLGDETAAEDVVHDAFLALPRALRSFRGDCSLRSFVFALAARRAKHHIRAAIRRRKAMERFVEQRDAGGERLPTAERLDLASVLTRALDALPAEHRVTYVLCEIEEVSGADAARMLDIPEATVRTRLFHARRKLREELEKEGVR